MVGEQCHIATTPPPSEPSVRLTTHSAQASHKLLTVPEWTCWWQYRCNSKSNIQSTLLIDNEPRSVWALRSDTPSARGRDFHFLGSCYRWATAEGLFTAFSCFSLFLLHSLKGYVKGYERMTYSWLVRLTERKCTNTGDTYNAEQVGAIGRYARSDDNMFIKSE